MSKKNSMYCFCNSAETRFSGGYLTQYPSTDVIEISLKFEKIYDEPNLVQNDNSTEKCNLNFVEISEKTLKNVCNNNLVHDCVKNLLENILIKKSFNDTSCNHTNNETPLTTSNINVTVHQAATNENEDIYINNCHDGDNLKLSDMDDLKVMQRNSSKRSSMKSSKSMETVLETNRQKDKSPDESKAKSVGNINDEKEDDEEYENCGSIELIFISDEFVNKMQQQQQEVIILDDKDGRRRESLTNKKKIVIITDQFKEKVLSKNQCILTERKMLKKLKKAKTYNTNSNSFLSYDEPDETVFQMDNKNFDDEK